MINWDTGARASAKAPYKPKDDDHGNMVVDFLNSREGGFLINAVVHSVFGLLKKTPLTPNPGLSGSWFGSGSCCAEP
ncbi:MAG: hypothetical protein QOJ19_3317 [Acidimicrobiia bacterium]|nr:hypothetical protein [Acidimicrobiia bacterium]